MAYLLYLLAGLVLANGVPHFVKGIVGEEHPTPFRKTSGSLLNVVWGMANFFVAGWLWLFASLMPHAIGFSLLSFFIGLFIGSMVLTKRPRKTAHRKPEPYASYV
ncbi:MAG: hypothetical protein V4681_01455 [Patescibacteria group bacterium]